MDTAWESNAASLMAWTPANEFDPARLGPGVTYQRAKTLSGRTIAYAPLGTPLPSWLATAGDGSGWMIEWETTS